MTTVACNQVVLMTDAECVEFAHILQTQLLIVWFDGKYREGGHRWGAREVGFIEGDEALEDPMTIIGSEQYGDTPLEAVRAVLAARKPRPKKGTKRVRKN